MMLLAWPQPGLGASEGDAARAEAAWKLEHRAERHAQEARAPHPEDVAA